MTEDSLPELVENPKLTLYAFQLCHDIASVEGQRVEDWFNHRTLVFPQRRKNRSSSNSPFSNPPSIYYWLFCQFFYVL